MTAVAKALNGVPAYAEQTREFFGGRPPAPPRHGTGSWSPACVRELLYRRLYRGEIVWGRTTKADRDGRAGVSVDRDPGEWLVVPAPDVRIVPFRGDYYVLRPHAHHLVRGLIYPVPDPRFPFLGVHFTRTVRGEVEAGPNAVLAVAREGYSKGDFNLTDAMETLTYPGFWAMARRYSRVGLRELYRSWSKAVFVRDLQRLIPEITGKDVEPGGSGVRAQALNRRGEILDDFSIVATRRAIHVLNAPSPGATASLAIGEHVAGLAVSSFGLDS
jgi:hypothetical protein